MVLTQSFNSLQKSAILRIIEMNNDELMGFLDQMNMNELENIIKEGEGYDELL